MRNNCDLPYLMDYRGTLIQADPKNPGSGCISSDCRCPVIVRDSIGNPILLEDATPEQIALYMPFGIPTTGT